MRASRADGRDNDSSKLIRFAHQCLYEARRFQPMRDDQVHPERALVYLFLDYRELRYELCPRSRSTRSTVVCSD